METGQAEIVMTIVVMIVVVIAEVEARGIVTDLGHDLDQHLGTGVLTGATPTGSLIGHLLVSNLSSSSLRCSSTMLMVLSSHHHHQGRCHWMRHSAARLMDVHTSRHLEHRWLKGSQYLSGHVASTATTTSSELQSRHMECRLRRRLQTSSTSLQTSTATTHTDTISSMDSRGARNLPMCFKRNGMTPHGVMIFHCLITHR